jgi:hypothetical protein
LANREACGKGHEYPPEVKRNCRGHRLCHTCDVDRYYRSKYGISSQNYEKMHAEQNGLCAICEQPETTVIDGKQIRLAVDHCHKTGEVRRLLCAKCNRLIGLANESFEILEKAAKYMRLFGGDDGNTLN